VWFSGAKWPLWVLFAGYLLVVLFQILHLQVIYSVFPGSSVNIKWWLYNGMLFLAPYPVCAVGLWLARRNQTISDVLRTLALLFLGSGLPAMVLVLLQFGNIIEVDGFSVTLPYTVMRTVTLYCQIPLAVLILAVGSIAWLCGRQVRKDPTEPVSAGGL
jgi:hypothetical protein